MPAPITAIKGAAAPVLTLYTPTDECLRDVPEVIESEAEACLQHRNTLINHGFGDELGPHDLVLLIKTKGRKGAEAKSSSVSSWHWVSGLDTSSSASIAAYITDLSHTLIGGNSSSNWVLGKLGGNGGAWRVSQAIVCSWNAFRREDVRVEISIPGGVRSYRLDESLKQLPTGGPEAWAETSVSSILRSLQPAEAETDPLGPINKLEPFPAGKVDEARFLENAKRLIQSPSKNRKLAQAILGMFLKTQRPGEAFAYFAPLAQEDGLLKPMLVQSLFAMEREAEAVQMLCSELKKNQTSPELLRIQAEFLIRKGETGIAEGLLKRAIQVAPMGLTAWSALARLQVATGRYASALTSLNGLPYLPEHPNNNAFDFSSTYAVWQPRDDPASVDLSLVPGGRECPLESLAAPKLKGTARVAYEVLVEMLGHLGWDGLLAVRAQVFVMEDEFKRPDAVRAEVDFEKDAGVEDHAIEPADGKQEQAKRVVTKRICERWLDALFTILFSDVRVHTMHMHATDPALKRTPRQWLLLARLCSRLGKPDEARFAYEQCCSAGGFSRTAWSGLLSLWCASPDVLGHALEACRRLANDAINRHEQVVHHSGLGYALRALVRRYGMERVRLAHQRIDEGRMAKADALISALLERAASEDCLGSDY